MLPNFTISMPDLGSLCGVWHMAPRASPPSKSPPILGEILIANVEGGSAAHYSNYSSMTSSSTAWWLVLHRGGPRRGAYPSRKFLVAFGFECDWTMNSWVFRQYRSCLQSQSIMSLNVLAGHPGPIRCAGLQARARCVARRDSCGTASGRTRARDAHLCTHCSAVSAREQCTRCQRRV